MKRSGWQSSRLAHAVRIGALVLCGCSGKAAAQDSVEFDVGMRGGLLPGSSFQADRLCFSGPGCQLTRTSFTGDKMTETIGLTAGILLKSGLEFRVESGRRHFDYQIRTDSSSINGSSSRVESTQSFQFS
jgi:hypothetical protein